MQRKEYLGMGRKGKGHGNDGGGKGACSRCGKTGHSPANCWTLHPEQLPWKRAGAGAAESAMRRGLLPTEPLTEGIAKRKGVKHVAVHGAKMENLGEKKV